MRIISLIVVLLFSISCASSGPKIIKQTSTQQYISLKGFETFVSRKGKNYVVFTAPWCPACKKLKSLLKQEGIYEKVLFLDLESDWVQILAKCTGVKSVPLLYIFHEGKLIGSRTQPGEILVFLIANIEKN